MDTSPFEDNLDRLFGESSQDEAEFETRETSQPTTDLAAAPSSQEQQKNEEERGGDTTKQMTVRKLRTPRERNLNPILLKLPGFLGFDREPYSAAKVLDEELGSFEGTNSESGDAAGVDVLLRAATTVRWRLDSSQEGRIQSNARLVNWSDGSWSLMIGEEMFDVSLQNMATEHNYIFERHAEEGSMECVGKLKERLTIRPYITTNQSHRRYLAAAATASAKSSADVRVKLAVTMADPEMEKQRMIKLEQEKIKARRKLEARRRNLQQRSYERLGRTGLTAHFLEERDLEEEEEEEEYEGEERTGVNAEEDEYDEDFIDDTELPEGEGSRGGETESAEESEESSEIESEEEIPNSRKGQSKFEKRDNGRQAPSPKKRRPAAILDEEE